MEGILEDPTCRHCGFDIETDCIIGAGCPRCGRQLLPDPVVAAGPGEADFAVLRGELDRLVGENAQLRARVSELEAKKDRKPKEGSHGGA